MGAIRGRSCGLFDGGKERNVQEVSAHVTEPHIIELFHTPTKWHTLYTSSSSGILCTILMETKSKNFLQSVSISMVTIAAVSLNKRALAYLVALYCGLA